MKKYNISMITSNISLNITSDDHDYIIINSTIFESILIDNSIFFVLKLYIL